jgi:carboxyl-terminal processing protease
MNSKLRGQIFSGIFATVLIGFGAGYFAGNHSFPFSTRTQAGEQADLTAFWKVWNALNEKYVSASTTQNISDEEKIYGAISGLVDSVGDPYTVFFTPEEKEDFDESITGTFSGVGMEVGIQDGYLTVVAPLKGSPSEKAGVEPGDKILSIDGESAEGLQVDEAVSVIRGPKGTVVTLEVLRKDESAPREIKITRDTIVVPTIETETIGDVFVIRLYTFGTGATSEFRNALRQFVTSKKTNLVLDLRGNPGGYLDAAVDISSWFLPAGKVVVSEDFGPDSDPKVFRSKGYNVFRSNLRMVVLINEGSASASEIVAGALQEHGVAKLVGEKSFGKGSVQELIDITPTTALKVTVARWLTPNGTSISNGGLMPDVEVEFDAELFKEKEVDNQLQKALELLK